jgi:hypothetical protein
MIEETKATESEMPTNDNILVDNRSCVHARSIGAKQ